MQMGKKEKTLLLILAGMLTTLVVFVTVKLWAGEAALTIIPGWHTTIYTPEITWTILTILILATSLMVNLIFRVAIKLLVTLRTKLKA